MLAMQTPAPLAPRAVLHVLQKITTILACVLPLQLAWLALLLVSMLSGMCDIDGCSLPLGSALLMIYEILQQQDTRQARSSVAASSFWTGAVMNVYICLRIA